MRRNHRAESPVERGSSHATPRWGIAALLLPLAFGAGNVGVAKPPPDDPVRVVIETEMGAFELEVDVGRAPGTASNFLRYLDGGHYDGGTFFRTVHADNQPDDSIRIAVIQGGRNPDAAADPFPAIALERTSETGLRHVDGAVSMGRTGPDTATDSFFICIGDQPSLDFGGMRNPDGQGFAAFGRVIDGMDVVRAIHAAPYEAQRLTPPVEIGRAYRKE
ncbi:MAG: peptidylprolyl isomerase [Acidobacteriota bacterium]|nr:peptidylprolyl isomerase [Acidobacteriota bacterium]